MHFTRAGTTDYDSVDREIGTTGGRIFLPIPIHRYSAKSTEYRYRSHGFGRSVSVLPIGRLKS